MLFSTRSRQDREAARLIYAAIVAQARHPAFFTELHVPDTLNGRFEMMALHLFAVTTRLMQPGDGDPALGRLVAEAFVEDMDSALRDMGVGDTKVPKRMRTLYGSHAGRMKAYGEGIAGPGQELAAAVARNVFPDGGLAASVAQLESYLRRSVAALSRVPTAEIRRGILPFPAVLDAVSPPEAGTR